MIEISEPVPDSVSKLYRDMMQYAFDIQDGKKDFEAEKLVDHMQEFGERMAMLTYQKDKYWQRKLEKLWDKKKERFQV